MTQFKIFKEKVPPQDSTPNAATGERRERNGQRRGGGGHAQAPANGESPFIACQVRTPYTSIFGGKT